MQQLQLKRIDFLSGNDFIYDGKIPSRLIYLRDISEETTNKGAWEAMRDLCIETPLVFSDIYRSPASSAEAYARKTGVAKPGYSGHNYGISVDLAVDATLKRYKWTYPQLVNVMINNDWTPFQGKKSDNQYIRGKEDWHFNYAGQFGQDLHGSAVVEGWIRDNIQFDMDIQSIQAMLAKLKFYHGDADGKIGPLSTEAIKKFQQAWLPKTFGVSGKLDELTIRTINIVSTDVIDENGKVII